MNGIAMSSNSGGIGRVMNTNGNNGLLGGFDISVAIASAVLLSAFMRR
jgi:hypothetical protein|tara:strand:- start:2002 stop:2145 length:144 start_codon:yes stop_codon:yes gene_type:complete